MGDGSQDATLANQVSANLGIANTMYSDAFRLRKAGTDYAIGAYKMGGFDQSAKFQSMQSGILDAMAKAGPGDFRNPGELGGSAAMRAEAVSNVGSQKLMAGMEEMQKIRGLLAGSGLSTTNFAESEGKIGVKAASMMDPNARMSNINAGLGLAATVYGTGKNAGWWTSKTPGFNGTDYAGQIPGMANAWALGSGPTPSSGFGLGSVDFGTGVK